MVEYQPLIRYRARPFDGDFAITGRFGQTDDAWTPAKPHLGVDFGCPAGTPIYATTFGRAVPLTVDDGSFGLYALVDCRTKDDEPTVFYDLHAHLSQVSVLPGQAVRPGTLLGLSGATGFVTGAHLHWQTCRNRPDFPRDLALMVDPLSFPVEALAPAEPAPDVDAEMAAFMADVCRGMGWEPTPWRLDALRHWADLEDDSRWRLLLIGHNPLATTRQTTGVVGTWNSAGVKLYRDRAAGVVATVETLRLSYYPNVRRCFELQQGLPDAVPELVTYIGSEGYARELVAYMAASTASRGLPGTEPSALTAEQLNAAIQKRMAIIRLANSADLEPVSRAFDLLKREGLL